MNKVLAAAMAVVAFFVGIGISTMWWRSSNDVPEFSMHVEGNFGAAVTVTTTGHPTTEKQSIKELISGDGRTIRADEQVLMRATKFNAQGDEWSQVADLPTIVSGVATSESVGKLADVVVGKKEGSRLAVVRPVDGRVSITIVDILPSRIIGEPQSQKTDVQVPDVTATEDGIPVVGTMDGAIDNVKVTPVIAGSGAQVSEDDVVYANYILAKTDGTEIENTFTNGNPPAYIAVNEVFAGLQAGLVDQRVGSRIAVAVPSAQAQGDSDVVIVIDILALADKQPTSKSTNV
ncbi:FKBP-type peptidyl-prolyl cis-trans isomerase [Arcanobacterium phocae]|uniref:FKBP-type peptidyl-prolyl cis-trans isomerase n=1 Tax=Arcanobacterium phocae TaxID=131112 RepID=UPI001C0F23EE|nr:FKBP-type peptidyl-prolyl cis-trans isomerase [Arcanobacterium phocae]